MLRTASSAVPRLMPEAIMRCSLTYRNLIYELERCQLGGRTGGRLCIAFGFSTSTSNPNTTKGRKRRERNETRKKKGGKKRVRQEKNEGKRNGSEDPPLQQERGGKRPD